MAGAILVFGKAEGEGHILMDLAEPDNAAKNQNSLAHIQILFFPFPEMIFEGHSKQLFDVTQSQRDLISLFVSQTDSPPPSAPLKLAAKTTGR
jgi:hypothetical protein